MCVYNQLFLLPHAARRAMAAAVLSFYMTIIPSLTGIAVLVGFPFLLYLRTVEEKLDNVK